MPPNSVGGAPRLIPCRGGPFVPVFASDISPSPSDRLPARPGGLIQEAQIAAQGDELKAPVHAFLDRLRRPAVDAPRHAMPLASRQHPPHRFHELRVAVVQSGDKPQRGRKIVGAEEEGIYPLHREVSPPRS